MTNISGHHLSHILEPVPHIGTCPTYRGRAVAIIVPVKVGVKIRVKVTVEVNVGVGD